MARRIELVAEVSGVVWQVPQDPGTTVAEGDAVVIIESMKMESPVEAPCAAKILEIRCAPSDAIREGDVVAILEVA